MTTSITSFGLSAVVAQASAIMTQNQLWNNTSAADKAGKTIIWIAENGNLAVSSFDARGEWTDTKVNGQYVSDTLVRGGASNTALINEITAAKTVVVAPVVIAPDVTTQESMDGGETDVGGGFDLVNGVAVPQATSKPTTYTLTREDVADIINTLSGHELTAVAKAMFGAEAYNLQASIEGKTNADALATWGLSDSLEIGQFSASDLAALQSVGYLEGMTVAALNNVIAGGEAHVSNGVLGKAHTLASLTASLNEFINGTGATSFGAANTLYMNGFMSEGAVVGSTVTLAMEMFVAGSIVERIEQGSDVILMNAISMLSTGDTFTVGTGANYTPDAIASLKREWDAGHDARIENLNDLAIGLNKVGLIGVIDASDIAALADGHTVYA